MHNRQKDIEVIVASFQSLKRHFVCQAKRSGLTHAQWGLLSLIRDNKGICTGKIAEMLDVSSSAVTQLVNDLEKSGLVERKPSQEDKRILEISLTEEAHIKFVHMRQERAENLARLFDTFDDQEFSQYVQLTKKILSHI